jgi:hypothetical protein
MRRPTETNFAEEAFKDISKVVDYVKSNRIDVTDILEKYKNKMQYNEFNKLIKDLNVKLSEYDWKIKDEWVGDFQDGDIIYIITPL